MPFFHRRHFAAVSLGLLAVTGLYVAGATTPEFDFWHVPELRREQENAERLNEELETRRLVLSESIRLKEAIIQDLIAGRITLREAAAQFDAVSATPLDRYLGDEGATREERLCRLVIVWVEKNLSDRPNLHDSVMRRLEMELAQHVNPHESAPLAAKPVDEPRADVPPAGQDVPTVEW